jgi:hypothetical protein
MKIEVTNAEASFVDEPSDKFESAKDHESPIQ